MRKVILASLLAAGLASQANAAPIWCSGNVEYFEVHPNGRAIFKPTWSAHSLQVCNVELEWRGVPVSVCMAWVAKIDAAIGLSKRIEIKYDDVPACDQVPAYTSAPPPAYLRLRP